VDGWTLVIQLLKNSKNPEYSIRLHDKFSIPA